MKQIKNKTLYGCDVIYESSEDVHIESVSFPGFDNVETITISDFFYKYFKIEEGNFPIYDNEIKGDSPFAVASVFTPDLYDLQYITNSANVTTSPTKRKNNRIKKYLVTKKIFGCDEKEINIDDKKNISETRKIPREVKNSTKMEYIRVKYNHGNFEISMNMLDEDFMKTHLLNFFSMSEEQISFKKKCSALNKKPYLVSSLRAAIIAVQAALKFKTDIIFMYRPFYATGSVSFYKKTIFVPDGKQAGQKTIEGEFVKIVINTGFSTIFSKEIAREAMVASFPSYNVKYLVVETIIESGENIYNTDCGCNYYNKILAMDMYYQNKISKGRSGEFQVENFQNSKSIAKEYINYDINPLFCENVTNLLEKLNFTSKEELLSYREAGFSVNLSSIRRLRRRILCTGIISKEGISTRNSITNLNKIYRQSHGRTEFGISGPSFFIVEYNPYSKEIFMINTILSCQKGKNTEEYLSIVKGAILCACDEKGIAFHKDFSHKNFSIKLLETDNDFDSMEAIKSFALFLREVMENEN